VGLELANATGNWTLADVAHGDTVSVRGISRSLEMRWAVLSPVRQISTVLLSCGMRLTPLWIPTSLNPADEPSRRLKAANSPRFLQRASAEASTRNNYTSAYRCFCRWLLTTSPVPLHKLTVLALDRALSRYFHAVFRLKAGRGRGHCAHVLYGLTHYRPPLASPSSSTGFSSPLAGWARLVPSKSYPPVSTPIPDLLALSLYAMSFTVPAHRRRKYWLAGWLDLLGVLRRLPQDQ
jgi:hypothetical protein